MERPEFEHLRDLPGKSISGAVKFKKSKNTSPAVRAEDIVIENSAGLELMLDVMWNPKRGSKTFNVTAVGAGPICRLDVDGPPHRPAGQSHKHSLKTPACPDENLPLDVKDMPHYSGKSVRDLFDEFCGMANISFTGTFEAPDEATQHANETHA